MMFIMKYRVWMLSGNTLPDGEVLIPSNFSKETLSDGVHNYPFNNKGFADNVEKTSQICVISGSSSVPNYLGFGRFCYGDYKMPDGVSEESKENFLNMDAARLIGSMYQRMGWVQTIDDSGKVSTKGIENSYNYDTDDFEGKFVAFSVDKDAVGYVEFASPEGVSDEDRLCQIAEKMNQHMSQFDPDDGKHSVPGVLCYDENHKLVFDSWSADYQTPDEYRKSLEDFVKTMGNDVLSYSIDGVEQSLKKETTEAKHERRNRQLDAKFGDMLEADSNKYTLDNEMGD